MLREAFGHESREPRQIDALRLHFIDQPRQFGSERSRLCGRPRTDFDGLRIFRRHGIAASSYRLRPPLHQAGKHDPAFDFTDRGRYVRAASTQHFWT